MSGTEGKDTRALPKRFYKAVSIGKTGDGAWQLLLDERPVRTPGKTLVAVPSEPLADALAQEWRAQGERIDPATMPMTKIVNSAIDGVRGREAEVAAEIVAFAGSDLLCYRAEGPDDLARMQSDAWDPVLAWAHEEFGARFILAQGVMPVEQPQVSLEAFEAELREFEALKLCALHVVTTLTGSALLALAHARGELTLDAAWRRPTSTKISRSPNGAAMKKPLSDARNAGPKSRRRALSSCRHDRRLRVPKSAA